MLSPANAASSHCSLSHTTVKGVKAIADDSPHAGDHYTSYRLRHPHNKTPVSAEDIRTLKPQYAPMLKKGSEYLQTYAMDDKSRWP